MKKIILLSLLLLNTVFAATYTLRDTLSPYAALPAFADGDTIIVIGQVVIETDMILPSGTTGIDIQLASNAVLQIGGGAGGNPGSLTVNGFTPSSTVFRLRTGDSGTHGSIIIETNGTANIKNATIQDANYGITIKNDDVVVENVVFESPSIAGQYIIDSSPLLFNCWVNAPGVISVQLVYNTNIFSFPHFYANHFDFSTNPGFPYHFYIQATGINSDRDLYVEGNYWDGIAPAFSVNAAGYTINTDYSPQLDSSAFGNPNIYLAGGAGAAGTLNDDFYFFSNKSYGVIGGDLTVANGVNVYMGIDRDLATYSGGTIFKLDTPSSLILENGSTLTSRGQVANRNTIRGVIGTGVNRWVQMDAQDGSDIELRYTTVQNAQTGINLATNQFTQQSLIVDSCSTGVHLRNSTLPALTDFAIQNCSTGINNNNYTNDITLMNLNANTTGILVSAGNVDIYNNIILGGQKGVEARAACTIRNNTITGATRLIHSNNAAPSIRQNTLNGAGSSTGLLVDGGATQPAQLQLNDFVNCATNIRNDSGSRLTAESNWFGSSPPDKTDFAGADDIDYEPWLDAGYATGSDTDSLPIAVQAASITPADGANLAVAPTQFLFRTTDDAYYGNNHLYYQLQVDDEPTFTLPRVIDEISTVGANFDQNYYADNEQVDYDSSGATFAAGGTYYWRVRVRDPWGTDTFVNSATFQFTVSFPQLDITVDTSDTEASAGDEITFTLNFANTTPLGDASNVYLNYVLPDEVSSNGVVSFSSMDPSIGNVVINVYADPDGTVLLDTDSFVAAGATYTYNIPAGLVDQVVRYEIIMDNVNNGISGSVGIGSYVE